MSLFILAYTLSTYARLGHACEAMENSSRSASSSTACELAALLPFQHNLERHGIDGGILPDLFPWGS